MSGGPFYGPGRIAIHGVGLASPHGSSLPSLARNLREGHLADLRPPPPAREGNAWPHAKAFWLDRFEGANAAGVKGLAALDRLTQLVIVASMDALASFPAADEETRRATGIVVGTRAGSTGSSADFLQATYKGLPHKVSPIQFPSTAMNCAAGQLAIWHGLTGMNATVCGGDATGLVALHYAARLLRQGHARQLLVAAAEEYTPFNAWAHRAAAPDPSIPFTEAAVTLALSLTDGSAQGTPPFADLLGTSLGQSYAAPADLELERCLSARIDAVLQAAGCRASDLCWFQPASWAGAAALDAQWQALARIGAGGHVARPEPVPGAPLGHAHGAAVALDLAAALACAPLGVGLVTAVGEAGQVGCALVGKNLEVPTN